MLGLCIAALGEVWRPVHAAQQYTDFAYLITTIWDIYCLLVGLTSPIQTVLVSAFVIMGRCIQWARSCPLELVCAICVCLNEMRICLFDVEPFDQKHTVLVVHSCPGVCDMYCLRMLRWYCVWLLRTGQDCSSPLYLHSPGGFLKG